MALRKMGGGGTFLNLLQKEGDTQKGEIPSEKEGGGGGFQPWRKLWTYASLRIMLLLLHYVYIIYASLRIMILLLHDRWIQHHALSSTSYVITLPKVRNVSVIYL